MVSPLAFNKHHLLLRSLSYRSNIWLLVLTCCSGFPQSSVNPRGSRLCTCSEKTSCQTTLIESLSMRFPIISALALTKHLIRLHSSGLYTYLKDQQCSFLRNAYPLGTAELSKLIELSLSMSFPIISVYLLCRNILSAFSILKEQHIPRSVGNMVKTLEQLSRMPFQEQDLNMPEMNQWSVCLINTWLWCKFHQYSEISQVIYWKVNIMAYSLLAMR